MDYLLSSPTIQYCEIAISNVLIARPWYALSNLAFIIVGVLILIRGGRHSQLFGSIAILVGALSFIYDVSYTYLSQLLDLSGMLLLICLLLYLNLRLVMRHKTLVRTLILGFVMSLCLIIAFKGFAGNIIFGLLVITYIAIELYLLKTKQHIGVQRWLLILSIFLIGFLFWLGDASRVYCSDIGILNGRAVFHYTNAMTIYALFMFYRLQGEGISSKSRL